MTLDRRDFLAGSAAAVALAALPLPAIAAPRRFLLMPDVMWVEHATRIEHENQITVIYRYMMRWDTETGDMWNAPTDHPVYARWLAEDVAPGEIPPHIGFGGCIVPVPGGDSGAYARWQAFARTLA